jgi:tripartite-type tricarboxylate transporter receptor subunit TctC
MKEDDMARGKVYMKMAGVFLVVLQVAAVAVGSALAEYPDKPISMIVTYSPGGATDFQARIVTMLASEEKYLGQPIVIINKPGAGGQVGWNWFVEKASKDGYNMVTYNVPHFIAQSIVYDTKYSIEDFEPVGNWGADPAVLIVGKDSPFNTLEDFIKYAKENPGKITVSGAGMFVGHHIATLQLAKAAGIKLTYIPEKGGVDAIQSVMSGKVKAGFNNLADSFRSQDNLRILAIADLKRHPYLPDVRTFKEAGLDVDDSSVNFRGVALPKGTPKEIIDKCAEIFPKMFNDPRILAKMKESGSPVRVMSREEVIKMFQNSRKELVELLKELKKK